MQLEFSYGEGQYIEKEKSFVGQVILGTHKLYIKGPDGDFPQTYIPIEKIERMKIAGDHLEFFVRPSVAFSYTAAMKVDGPYLRDQAHDLVQKLQMKKQFLKAEWIANVTWT